MDARAHTSAANDYSQSFPREYARTYAGHTRWIQPISTSVSRARILQRR